MPEGSSEKNVVTGIPSCRAERVSHKTPNITAWAWPKWLLPIRLTSYFGTSARNAAYNVADQLAQPVLLLAAAPFLTHRLGLEYFGIWMLASALTGSIPLFNLGLSDATVKYVAKYRGSGHSSDMVRVFRASLTISGICGVLAGSSFLIGAPLLAHWIFRTPSKDYVLVVHVVELSGLILTLRSVEAVLGGSLRAVEDYPAAAKVSVSVKCGIVASAVFLVLLGCGVTAILLATVTCVALGLLAYAITVKRRIPEIRFWPRIERDAWREIASFGFYSWLQGLAAVLFSSVDRLLLGALMGTAAVAYYAVCVQLAGLVHAVPAAAFNFLFPYVSARSDGHERGYLWRVFRNASTANLIAVALLALPLLVTGKTLLAKWMGSNFAEHSYTLLAILIAGYAVLACNVVPHFTLLGIGQVRFVCGINLVGGLLTLASMALLIPLTGLLGAGLGRLLYGPVIGLSYLRVARLLHGSKSLVLSGSIPDEPQRAKCLRVTTLAPAEQTQEQ